ncbi:MAG: hypothetical protein H6830_12940 [Planctomycetes bacterium]|nr:hypothetical protein [Planctomycetota bacterium]MCB9912893.1 hypothetical protein [Planctomycetota bacterium]HPF14536.1 hypothetical protein [Planctomycetota bacterium]
MKKTLLLALLSGVVFASPGLAGDLLITFEGHVTQIMGSGMPSGPFVAAQVGDAMRCSLEFEQPPPLPFDTVFYTADFDSLSLRIGQGEETGNIPAGMIALVGNDVPYPSFPTVDFLSFQFPTIGLGNVSILVEDPQGQIFSTNYLSAIPGPRLVPSSSYLEVRYLNTTDGIRVRLDQMAIYRMEDQGSTYCAPAAINSLGVSGTLEANGSDYAAAERLVLLADYLPSQQFALLLAGTAQASPTVPTGSQGNLCIGGTLARFNQLLTNTDNGLTARFDLDPFEVPLAPGTLPIVAGSTYHFQVWYRDSNPSPTSNFTEALSVTFQ